jgi:hypothetical protein
MGQEMSQGKRVVPEGFVYVRSHIRRRPTQGGRKLSGWTIAGIVAGIWLWGQVFGFGESESEPESERPAGPEASVSEPAAP